MTKRSISSLVMLLVEDNPADVAFLIDAIERCKIGVVVHTVDNGDDAMRFLRRDEPFTDVPRPDVMILDLNLPAKRGHQILAEIMSDPTLRTMPVAILTTSTSERHLSDNYTPGRCLYFVKTDEPAQLQGIVTQIAEHAKELRNRG